MSSDKNFLIVLSIILLFVYIISSIYFLFFLSIFFFIFAFLKPNFFHILNYLIFRLGMFFMILMQPIIKLIIYIFIFGLIGFSKRIFGYDPLKLKVKKKSTWTKKKQISSDLKKSFKQF